MKKAIKKSISVFLAMLMLVSMLSVLGYAEAEKTIHVFNKDPYVDLSVKVGDDAAETGEEFYANSGETVTLYANARENCTIEGVQALKEEGEPEDTDVEMIDVEKTDESTYSFVMPDNTVEIIVKSTPKAATGIFGDLITKQINTISKKFGMVPCEVEAALAEYIADEDNYDVPLQDLLTEIATAKKTEGFNALDYMTDVGVGLVLAFLSLDDIVDSYEANYMTSNFVMYYFENVNSAFAAFGYSCDEILKCATNAINLVLEYCEVMYEMELVPVNETMEKLALAKADPASVPVPQGNTLAQRIAPYIIDAMERLGFEDVTTEIVSKNVDEMVEIIKKANKSSEAITLLALGEAVELTEDELADFVNSNTENPNVQQLLASCDTVEKTRDLLIKLICYASAPMYTGLFSETDVTDGLSDIYYANGMVKYVCMLNAYIMDMSIRQDIIAYEDGEITKKDCVLDLFAAQYFGYSVEYITYTESIFDVVCIRDYFLYMVNEDLGVVTNQTMFERYKAEKIDYVNGTNYSAEVKANIIANIQALEYDETITLDENKANVDKLTVVEEKPETDVDDETDTEVDEFGKWYGLLYRLIMLVFKLVETVRK